MKKIMFSDVYGLTKAVLEGRKTQTRRIITPQPTYDESTGICWKGYAYGINFSGKEGAYKNFVTGTEYNKSCKRYRVGEIVAIAQSYKDCGYSEHVGDICEDKDGKIILLISKSKGWTNKMFVKSSLMIHKIQITNVRIQRLQDISDEDCLKEGILKCQECGECYFIREDDLSDCSLSYDNPKIAYAALIDKVSGKGTWESNPYVWAYDFELVK